MPTPKPVRSAAPNPMPIQFTPFEAKHFSTPEGLAFVNLQFSQIVNALNRGTGQGGPVVLPAGINVAGASVTGLGKPSDPSDAVSLGHAEGNYGPAAVSPNLDIGGTSTLKGLAAVYAAVQPGANVSGTIILAKLTGGGTEGSITVLNGIVTKFVAST